MLVAQPVVQIHTGVVGGIVHGVYLQEQPTLLLGQVGQFLDGHLLALRGKAKAPYREPYVECRHGHLLCQLHLCSHRQPRIPPASNLHGLAFNGVADGLYLPDGHVLHGVRVHRPRAAVCQALDATVNLSCLLLPFGIHGVNGTVDILVRHAHAGVLLTHEAAHLRFHHLVELITYRCHLQPT